MSLDLYLESPAEVTRVIHCEDCEHTHEHTDRERYWATNITHNLNKMFSEAGIYEILWHGDGLIAGEVLPKLKAAMQLMREHPARFKQHDASNGWGTYEHAFPWLAKVIQACSDFPHAVLRCSR